VRITHLGSYYCYLPILAVKASPFLARRHLGRLLT